MTTYYWASAVSGAWTTAADWTPPGGPTTTGGGSGGFPPPQSADDAVFATGSATAYAVTVGGESASLRVSGDRVNFVHFRNGEEGYGGALTADGGAVVTVDAASVLDYAAHDGYGGGPVLVNGARVFDHGLISAGSVTLQDRSTVVDSGSKAYIDTYGGLRIDATSVLDVTAGGTLATVAPGATVDGTINVSGAGSTASLGQLQGAGHINVNDHAGASVYGDVIGTTRFTLGNAAKLAFSYGTLSSGTTVSFTGDNAALTLDGGPAGEIAGFGKSNAIVVGNTVSNAVWTPGPGGNGHLVLKNGNTTVETLNVRGNYTGDTFNVAAAGSGETKITLSVPNAPPGVIQLETDILSTAGGNATLSAGIAEIDKYLGGVGNVQDFFRELGTLAGSGGSPPLSDGSHAAIQHAALDMQQILSDGSKITFLHASH